MSPAAYLDTSVVVAFYVPEPLSAQVQGIYNGQVSPTISELVELEFFAALSLRVHIGDLDRTSAERAGSLFLGHLEGGWYGRLHLHAGHYVAARGYIARFDLPLKSPDPLHLAVAALDRLLIITADQQLARNAERLGLAVELVRAI